MNCVRRRSNPEVVRIVAIIIFILVDSSMSSNTQGSKATVNSITLEQQITSYKHTQNFLQNYSCNYLQDIQRRQELRRTVQPLRKGSSRLRNQTMFHIVDLNHIPKVGLCTGCIEVLNMDVRRGFGRDKCGSGRKTV